MRWIVVLSRRGESKSTVGAHLGRILDLPDVEPDAYFWSHDLTPPGAWARVRAEPATADR